jgi:methionyl-tRNA formyltransferase
MRIIVNGQQAFGEAVLRALVKRGETVVAVYCAPEKEGGRPDPMRLAAEELGLPVFQPKSFRDTAVHEQIASLKPDLGVMAFVTAFVPSACLNIPTYGTIQYHPSLLPLHRGPSAINWSIIQGRKETGLSIFWPDDGLDTGPILLQKSTPIGPDDTLGSVYFDRLFPMGVEAMLESVDLVRAGKAPKIEQDHALQTYEGWCRADDCIIDWSKSGKEVYNLIRGANPSPGASTLFQGERLFIYDSKRHAGAGGKAGLVSAIDEHGVTVQTSDDAIKVERVKHGKGAKEKAFDWAQRVKLSVGTQLGSA